MDSGLILRAVVAASCSLWIVGAAGAQLPGDPMRPPGFALNDPAGAQKQNVAEQTGLQSILVSNGRKFAVINGQTYSIGQKVGDATLSAIRENEVVLRTASSSEILKLYPQAEKKLRQTGKAEKKAVEGARMSAGGK